MALTSCGDINNCKYETCYHLQQVLRHIDGCQGLARSIPEAQRRQINPPPQAQLPDLASPNASQHPVGQIACWPFPFRWKAPRGSQPYPLAGRQVPHMGRDSDSVAEGAASRKDNKYSAIA